MKNMTRILSLAAPPVLVSAIAAGVVAAQTPQLSEEALATLSGSWSGAIVVDETRSQDVLWRFDRTSSGALDGFMGPAAFGGRDDPDAEHRVRRQRAHLQGGLSTWRVGRDDRQGTSRPQHYHARWT